MLTKSGKTVPMGFILPFVFAQLLLTEETNSDKFKFYVKNILFCPFFP